MAATVQLLLRFWQWLASCYRKLPGNQVLTANHFRYRMLYLQAGIHFHKIEIVAIEQKLNGAGAHIVNGFGRGKGTFAHLLTHGIANAGGWCFLNDLLMAALH